MLTYKKLEKDFEASTEQLQKSCKCKYKSLSLRNDNFGVGCGAIYPSVIATCRICNKEYIVFRGDQNPAKTSPKIKKVLNQMVKNNYFRCWLEEESQGNNEPIFEER